MTSEGLVSLLLDTAVKALVLLGLIGVIVRLFARYRPALRAILWSQSFVALLVLPVAYLVFPAWRLPILPASSSANAISHFIPAIEHPAPHPPPIVFDQKNTPFVSPKSTQLPQNPPISPAAPVAPPSPIWTLPSWSEWIVFFYLLGVSICLSRVGVGWWRIRTLRLNVHQFAGPKLMTRLGSWCRRLGISDEVDIGISDQISIPTVIGFTRPLIVVPTNLDAKATDADWDGVIVHELAHVKRHDMQWNLLGMLVSAFYWYHPLVHWARRDLADTREYACDDWAVSTLGNANCYADALLEVTAHTDRRLSQALGMDMARTSRVLNRVNRVLNPNARIVPHVGWMLSGIILLSMVTSAGVLGSLRPSVVVAQDDVSLNAENGEEAARWVRRQFFLYDYAAGYHEGEKLVSRFPDSVPLKAWYALNLISGSRTEAAQKVVAAMPSGEAWTAFAQAIVWRREHKAEALKLSKSALARHPGDPDFLWMRAQVLWKAQGRAAAVSFIDQNLNRVQNPASLLALKGDILAYQSISPHGDIKSPDMMRAAFTAFELALQRQPDNVSAYYRAGFFLWSMQRTSEAHIYLKRAAELSPHAERVHYLYWYVTLGLPRDSPEAKLSEIESDISRLLIGQRYDPRTLAAVARIQRRLNQPEKMQEIMDRILREFPESPEAEWATAYHLNTMRNNLSSENADLAEKAAYLEQLWSFVNRPEHKDKGLLAAVYQDLFQTLRTDPAAHPDDLLRVVQRMADDKRSDPKTAFHDGPIVLAERTVYDHQAEAIARRGVRVAETRAEDHRQGDVRKAFIHLADAYDALGWIYFNEGHLNEAESELLKAHQNDLASRSILDHLGWLYTRKGEWDRAETLFIEGMEANLQEDLNSEKGLRQLYNARNGTADGFPDYIELIRHRVEAHQKARILATRSNTLFAPPFNFKSIDGASLSLPALHGKVVILNMGMRIYAYNLHMLQKLSDHYAARNDVVVMHLDQDFLTKAIARKVHCTFPVIEDKDYIHKAHITQFATTWFLDRQGHIAYSTTGYNTSDAWLRSVIWRIDDLLETPTEVN